MEYPKELEENLLKISKKVKENKINSEKRERDPKGSFDAFFPKHIIDTFEQISLKNLLEIYPNVGKTLCEVVVQIISLEEFLTNLNQSDIAKLAFLLKGLLDIVLHKGTSFGVDFNKDKEEFIDIWSKSILTILDVISILTFNYKSLLISDIYESLKVVTSVDPPPLCNSFIGLFNALNVYIKIPLNGIKVSGSNYSIYALLTLLFYTVDDSGGYRTIRSSDVVTQICLLSSKTKIKPLLYGLKRFALSTASLDRLLNLSKDKLPEDAVDLFVEIIFKNIEKFNSFRWNKLLKNKNLSESKRIRPLFYSDIDLDKYNLVVGVDLPIEFLKSARKWINWPNLFKYALQISSFLPNIALGISLYGLTSVSLNDFYEYLLDAVKVNLSANTLLPVLYLFLQNEPNQLDTSSIAELLNNANATIDNSTKSQHELLIKFLLILLSADSSYGLSSLIWTLQVYYRALARFELTDRISSLVTLIDCSDVIKHFSYSLPIFSTLPFIEQLSRQGNKNVDIAVNLVPGNFSEYFTQSVYILTAPIKFFCMRPLMYQTYDYDCNKGEYISPKHLLKELILHKDTNLFNKTLAEYYSKAITGDIDALKSLTQICQQAGCTINRLMFQVSSLTVYKELYCTSNYFKFPSSNLILDNVKPFPRLHYVLKMMKSLNNDLSLKGLQLSKPDFIYFLYNVITRKLHDDSLSAIDLITNSGVNITSDLIISSLFPIFSKILFDNIAGDSTIKLDNVINKAVTELTVILKHLEVTLDFWGFIIPPFLDLLLNLATMNPLCYPALSSLMYDKFDAFPAKEVPYMKCGTFNRSSNGYSPISDHFTMCECHVDHFLHISMRLLQALVHCIDIKFIYLIISTIDNIRIKISEAGYRSIISMIVDIFDHLLANGPKYKVIIDYWKCVLTLNNDSVQIEPFSEIVSLISSNSGDEYELIPYTHQLLLIFKSDPSLLLDTECAVIREFIMKRLTSGVCDGQLARNLLLLLGLTHTPNTHSLIRAPLSESHIPKGIKPATELAHNILIDIISPHLGSKVGALTAQRLLSLLGYSDKSSEYDMYPGCTKSKEERFIEYFGNIPQLKQFTTTDYQCTKNIDPKSIERNASSDFQYFVWWILDLLDPSNNSPEKTPPEDALFLAVIRCCDLGISKIPKLASITLPILIKLLRKDLYNKINDAAASLLESLINGRKSILHVKIILKIFFSHNTDLIQSNIKLWANAFIYCGDYARAVYLIERYITYDTNADKEYSQLIPLLAKAFYGLDDHDAVLTLVNEGNVTPVKDVIRLLLEKKPIEALSRCKSNEGSYLIFKIGQQLPINYTNLFFNSLPSDIVLDEYSRGDALESCWKLRNWEFLETISSSYTVVNGIVRDDWGDVLSSDDVECTFKANFAKLLVNVRNGNDNLSIFNESLNDLIDPISISLWDCNDDPLLSNSFALDVLIKKLNSLAITYLSRGLTEDISIIDRIFSESTASLIPILRVALEASGKIEESVHVALNYGPKEQISDLYHSLIYINNLEPFHDLTCKYACYLVDSDIDVYKGLSMLEKLVSLTDKDSIENYKENPLLEHTLRCAKLNIQHPSETLPTFKRLVDEYPNKSILNYAKYLDSLVDKKLSNAYAVKIVIHNNEEKLLGITGITTNMSFLQLLYETFTVYLKSIPYCISDQCRLIFVLNRLVTLACVFCTPCNRDLYSNIWFDEKCCELFYKIIYNAFQQLPSGYDAVWYNVLPQLVSRSRHALLGNNIIQPLINCIEKLMPRHATWHTLHRKNDSLNTIQSQYKKLFHELSLVAMEYLEHNETNDLSVKFPGLWSLFNTKKFVQSKIVSPISQELSFHSAYMEMRGYSNSPFAQISNSKSPPTENDYIVSLCREFTLISSKQKPKRISWITNKGFVHSWLVKYESRGDLRKDSRMMDIFQKTNAIISNSKLSDPNFAVSINFFSVILLTEKCGVIEWINNMQTVGSAIREELKNVIIETKIQQLQKKYIKAINECKFAESYSLFVNYLLPVIPPVLHRVYMNWFGSDPLRWYKSRLNYMKSTAIWSILGFLVGLGDRHCDNLLVSKDTGTVLHVDFDCLFGKGLKLSVPEVVPFRLTQNIVAGMGICGILPNSPFMKYTLAVLKQIRDEKKYVMSLLLCFVFDPLIEWERGGKDNGTETGQCVTRQIEHKLRGAVNFTRLNLNSPSDIRHAVEPAAQGLDPSSQLDLLVATATCNFNLSRMFVGWAPWL